jgi:hypothetical protein
VRFHAAGKLGDGSLFLLGQWPIYGLELIVSVFTHLAKSWRQSIQSLDPVAIVVKDYRVCTDLVFGPDLFGYNPTLHIATLNLKQDAPPIVDIGNT